MNDETIDKVKKHLEDILTDFKSKQSIWTNLVKSYTNKLKCEIKEIIELQAEVLSQRQTLIEEKTEYWYKIYKLMPTLKLLRKAQFEYYSTKYQLKTNGSEKTKLIDADMAYNEAKVEYMQNYISFLDETLKTIDNINYSIKNKIDVYNITGID